MKVSCFNPFFERETDAYVIWEVGPYRIVRCPESGLLFLENPIEDARELKEFYSVGYFEGAIENKGYASYGRDEEILRHNFHRNIERIARDISKSGRQLRTLSLLDIGCAYGYFLDEARNSVYSIEGIEINDNVAAIGRERFGLKIDSAEDAMGKMKPGSKDIITMWDVVEHLKLPRSVLLDCNRVLAPYGSLYLTTGDVDSLLAKTMGRYWRLITPPQHICYFSVATIERLLRECGFAIVGVRKYGKHVSLSMILFQLSYMCGLRSAPKSRVLNQLKIPINLFDVMFVHARKIKNVE